MEYLKAKSLLFHAFTLLFIFAFIYFSALRFVVLRAVGAADTHMLLFLLSFFGSLVTLILFWAIGFINILKKGNAFPNKIPLLILIAAFLAFLALHSFIGSTRIYDYDTEKRQEEVYNALPKELIELDKGESKGYFILNVNKTGSMVDYETNEGIVVVEYNAGEKYRSITPSSYSIEDEKAIQEDIKRKTEKYVNLAKNTNKTIKLNFFTDGPVYLSVFLIITKEGLIESCEGGKFYKFEQLNLCEEL